MLMSKNVNNDVIKDSPIEMMWQKAVKHAFSVLYSDKTWVFDQSEHVQGPTRIIISY